MIPGLFVIRWKYKNFEFQYKLTNGINDLTMGRDFLP